MARVLQAGYKGYGPSDRLRSFTLKEKIGNHTVAFLDYNRTRSQFETVADDLPVAVRWGDSPLDLRVFYGYVNHQTTVREGGHTYSRIVAVGTSKPMNTAVPTTWTGQTRSGIARSLARRYGLRSVIHPHTVVVNSWTSGTDTDFAAFRRLCDETGYFGWIDGSTLYFLDPQRVLRGPEKDVVPVFTPRDISKAEVTGGHGAPRETGSTTRRVVYGLDTRTNETFQVVHGSSDLPTTIDNSIALIHDEALAVMRADEAMNQDYYTLDVDLTGNARITPNSIFALRGSSLSQDLHGYWLARSAEHTVTPGSFSSRIEAIRNKFGVPTISFTSPIPTETVPATIRNGKTWESTRLEHLNV